MNNIPVFDNVQFTTDRGHLTEIWNNNLTLLYKQLLNFRATSPQSDTINVINLVPDNNFVATDVINYVLPNRCEIGSQITVCNIGSGSFNVSINAGQSIQYETTVYTNDAASSATGCSMTLLCVEKDLKFLVIAHQGTINFS